MIPVAALMRWWHLLPFRLSEWCAGVVLRACAERYDRATEATRPVEAARLAGVEARYRTLRRLRETAEGEG